MSRRTGMDIRKVFRGIASALRRTLKATIGTSISASDRNPFFRFRRDQSGSYLIMSGLLMPALVGFVGFGTEVGLWLFRHQSLQGAADSGAVSAALAYSLNPNGDLNVQAKAIAASYGFVAGTNTVVVTVNQPPQSGTHINTPGAVEVIVQKTEGRLFSAVWSSQPVAILARAVAVANNTGFGCVLALDRTSSGAVIAQGNTSVTLTQCSLFDDSSSTTALTDGGSATISALSVGVVGGIRGTSGITTTQGIHTGINPVPDPYAGVSDPSPGACTFTSLVIVHTTETLPQGNYCGGLKLNAGADVTLTPGGNYSIGGSFDMAGSATLTGDGVTLVLTSTSTGATINGGATVDLTAPTTGATAGIAIFADRNIPLDTQMTFNGGGSQNINGAIYASTVALTYAGGATGNNGCTQIVADTIKFTGNSTLAINCTGTGTKPLGSAAVTLVE